MNHITIWVLTNTMSPPAKIRFFEKVIQDLEQQLPEELHLKDEERKYSVTVRDDRHRAYLHLNCYKYKNKKWRVKITPYERGKGFFKKAFKPLIEKL